MRPLRAVLTLALLLVGGAAGAAPEPRVAPACWSQAFEGDGFTVCLYEPATDELRLAKEIHGGLPGLKAALGDDAARVRFAMNAGMYEDEATPTGLFVADGQTRQPLNRAEGGGNFFLKPNGVFWTDAAGAPHIDETEAFAAAAPAARFATQSGPLLVAGGAMHPAVQPNGASRFIRNGVGVRGGLAYFVISDAPVSFGRFARFLRDALDCPDALYLDGSVSSLWAPGLARLDRRTGLGTFVLVARRRDVSPPGRPAGKP